MSVYAEPRIVKFETPFESSLIPSCSTEEVFFKGVAAFSFKEFTDKDGNVRQTVNMDYQKTTGVTSSGSEYIIHEQDRYVTFLEGSTTKFSSIIRGSFIAKGSEVNTQVMIKLITSIDENGDPHTIVDYASVKCNSEHG